MDNTARLNICRQADLEIGDTAALESCATSEATFLQDHAGIASFTGAQIGHVPSFLCAILRPIVAKAFASGL